MPPIQPSLEFEKSNGGMMQYGPNGTGANDAFLLSIATTRPELLPVQVRESEELLARLSAHGLIGRCQRLRRQIEAHNYAGDLLAGIDDLSHKIELEYSRNLAVLEAVSLTIGEGLGVMIKGASSFLLTSDKATLRCGDVDLVVPNGDLAVAHLLSMGFERTRAPFMHEIGELTRDGVELDLQRGFPVTRYPIARSEMGREGVGTWGLAQTCEINFQDLMRTRIAVTVKSGLLWIPSLEMAVLIAASHAFMNYINIWSISHRHKPWIRLCEFSDIQEMSSRPAFSWSRFSSLVERFQANDVVEWTAIIWTRLGGAPLFPGHRRTHTGDFPLNLWWNLWSTVRPDTGTLLADNWYPLPDLLREIDKAFLGPAPGRSPEWGPLTPLWESPYSSSNIELKGRRSPESIEILITGVAPTALLRLRLEANGLSEEMAISIPAGAGCTSGGTGRILVCTSDFSTHITLNLMAWRFGSGFVGLLLEKGSTIVVSTLIRLFDE